MASSNASRGRRGTDANARAYQQLTLLALGALGCSILVFCFMLLASRAAVAQIDALAAVRETAQVTRAVATQPQGIDEITLGAIADTLDLDRARLTTRDKVTPTQLFVPIGGDRVVAWTPHLFGSMTFGIVAPARILAGVLFVLVVALIGWRVHIVGKRLDRHRAVAVHLAVTDALTGVSNRLAFDAELHARATAAALPGGAGFVLLFADLDGLKELNDAFGHATGDAALQCVARTLREAADPFDHVARIGGDEFAVVRSGEGLDAYIADVKRRLGTPLPYDGKLLKIAASFGIARSEDFPGEAIKLSQAADAALYRAKRTGPGNAELAVPPRPRRAAVAA